MHIYKENETIIIDCEKGPEPVVDLKLFAKYPIKTINVGPDKSKAVAVTTTTTLRNAGYMVDGLLKEHGLPESKDYKIFFYEIPLLCCDVKPGKLFKFVSDGDTASICRKLMLDDRLEHDHHYVDETGLISCNRCYDHEVILIDEE